MVDSPPTYDADEVPMRKTMSIKEIRAEIFNLEGSIDWDNCDIENNYQLRWYRRLAAELASRKTGLIPPCRHCKTCHWHLSEDDSLECRQCGERPDPAYRSVVNYVYDYLDVRDWDPTVSTIPPDQFNNKCRWCREELGVDAVVLKIPDIDEEPPVCDACVTAVGVDTLKRALTIVLQSDDTTEVSD
jgi:hypothetical protein